MSKIYYYIIGFLGVVIFIAEYSWFEKSLAVNMQAINKIAPIYVKTLKNYAKITNISLKNLSEEEMTKISSSKLFTILYEKNRVIFCKKNPDFVICEKNKKEE